MEINKFFLNLERSAERRQKFDESWQRFEAVDGALLDEDAPIIKRMVSLWNTKPAHHRGKCGCWQSHYNLLCHIVNEKLNHVVVVEDDAEQIRELDLDLLQKAKNWTYLGGYLAHKRMYDGPLPPEKHPPHKEGINCLDKNEMRMIGFVAYYIPHWTIARDIVDYLNSKARVRAMDCQIYDIVKVPQDYIYPAMFVEEHSVKGSTIPRSNSQTRKKHPSAFYTLV